MITTIPTICGSVAANPSGLGVALHNAGYGDLRLPYTYIAMGANDLDEAIDTAKALQFRGLAVSMPHKVAVIEKLDEVGDDVRAIGACNTVVFDGGKLTGYNTDWVGARNALREADIQAVETALIVGAGGAARAIAYALKELGAAVYIAARRQEAAERLTQELGLAGALGIDDQGSVDAELLVNATPDSSASSPLQLVLHTSARAVFDVAFGQLETPLITNAKSQGLVTIAGWRMLLHQALEQFRLYTNTEPPVDVMASVLEKALSGRPS